MPPINRIRWAFSPHVRIRQKKNGTECLIWFYIHERVLHNSDAATSSWQLLALHFQLSLLADSVLGWRCGRNVIPLNGIFLKPPQESWQRQGDSRQVPPSPLAPSSPCSGTDGCSFQTHRPDMGLSPPRSHWWIRHLWRWGTEIC